MSEMEDVDPVNEDAKLYQVVTSASSDNIDLIAAANRTAASSVNGPVIDPSATPRSRTKTLAAATTSATSAIQHGHHPSSIPSSHPLSTKPMMAWNADDVATFLQLLDFTSYANLAKEARIHGPMLVTFSNDSLLQLGITNSFHRQRLLMEVAAIKHQQSKGNIIEDTENGPDLAMLEVILSSVVKIFCTSTTPHYSQPWQMKRQSTSTSSGFVVRGKRIIGNAHGVTNQTNVRIRRHGDATKYVARVLWVAHECDLVLLGVDDDRFWTGLEPLEFGKVPNLQESVTVVGYPTGGDNISVTKGVVSRVVVSTYTHSGEALLTIQIDAAINSGNSGGPAMQGAQVVGVAFEALTQAQNIGYIIPVPVINHVLEDLDRHGKYTGFPRIGFNWQKLENESLRRYFKVADNVHGILVTSVEPLDGAAKVLKPDDVITAIDGISVADDGTIFFRRGERLSFRYIETSKFNGDKLKFTLLRNGQPLDVDVTLQGRESLVPLHLHDQLPQYFVHAGLVFTVLSRAYMYHEWGKNWQTKAPVDLVQLAYYGLLDQRTRQVVILSQVLVDDVNNSYNAVFHNLILKSVDGVEVTNLRHLVEIVEKAEAAGTPFLRFNLERDKVICLDTKLARESTPRILKQNNIEYAKSVDLRSPL